MGKGDIEAEIVADIIALDPAEHRGSLCLATGLTRTVDISVSDGYDHASGVTCLTDPEIAVKWRPGGDAGLLNALALRGSVTVPSGSRNALSRSSQAVLLIGSLPFSRLLIHANLGRDWPAEPRADGVLRCAIALCCPDLAGSAWYGEVLADNSGARDQSNPVEALIGWSREISVGKALSVGLSRGISTGGPGWRLTVGLTGTYEGALSNAGSSSELYGDIQKHRLSAVTPVADEGVGMVSCPCRKDVARAFLRVCPKARPLGT